MSEDYVRLVEDQDAPPKMMRQVAPYPQALADIIGHLTYKPGWTIWLEDDMDREQGSEGLTLMVRALVYDSRKPLTAWEAMSTPPNKHILHLFPVPAASFNARSWRHWLFERLGDVDTHERAEFFQVDGELPFAPLHAPGNNPHMIVEATYAEAHTDNKGNFTDTR